MIAESTIIDIRGTKVLTRRAGAGPTLLYLHGFDGAAPAGALVDRLAGEFHVIFPDHPGMGESDTPPWLETIHDLAYFYLDFLAALDLRGVHLVGQNIGGWIALETAIRTSERLASVTLIGSAGIHVNGAGKGDLFMRPPDVVLRSLFADPSLAEPILARKPTPAEEDTRIKNRHTVARVGWQPPLFDPHLAKWLHRVGIPAHIVWGDTDRLFPIDYAQAFGRLLPEATTTVLRDCGHAAHIEKPAALAAAIVSFVREQAR